jgi:hypothetical protein
VALDFIITHMAVVSIHVLLVPLELTCHYGITMNLPVRVVPLLARLRAKPVHLLRNVITPAVKLAIGHIKDVVTRVIYVLLIIRLMQVLTLV